LANMGRLQLFARSPMNDCGGGKRLFTTVRLLGGMLI
jgi:hypothetical protein